RSPRCPHSFPTRRSSDLFAWLAKRRRNKFTRGDRAVWQASIPVIVIGNITVGGTGKTPLVIYIARLLQERGYKPGIVSRGYEAKDRKSTRLNSSHVKISY